VSVFNTDRFAIFILLRFLFLFVLRYSWRIEFALHLMCELLGRVCVKHQRLGVPSVAFEACAVSMREPRYVILRSRLHLELLTTQRTATAAKTDKSVAARVRRSKILFLVILSPVDEPAQLMRRRLKGVLNGFATQGGRANTTHDTASSHSLDVFQLAEGNARARGITGRECKHRRTRGITGGTTAESLAQLQLRSQLTLFDIFHHFIG
jgi:hypothetical protein